MPRQNYWPVTLSNLQRAVNDGEMAVVDLIATEMEQAAEYMKDGIGTQLYADGKIARAVKKVGDMLETLVRSLVLVPMVQ